MAKIAKRIEVKAPGAPMCGAHHDSSQQCHVILMRDDQNAIWGDPIFFKSIGQAQAYLSMRNISGFHPEHRFNGTQLRHEQY